MQRAGKKLGLVMTPVFIFIAGFGLVLVLQNQAEKKRPYNEAVEQAIREWNQRREATVKANDNAIEDRFKEEANRAREHEKLVIEAVVKAGSRVCVAWHHEDWWIRECTDGKSPCQINVFICDGWGARK